MPKLCCINFFNKLPEDEPVFTLAGRDQLAADTIRFWLKQAEAKGVNTQKIMRAQLHLDAIVKFQEENPSKTKLPD